MNDSRVVHPLTHKEDQAKDLMMQIALAAN
jgi:hypothetical protein